MTTPLSARLAVAARRPVGTAMGPRHLRHRPYPGLSGRLGGFAHASAPCELTHEQQGTPSHCTLYQSRQQRRPRPRLSHRAPFQLRKGKDEAALSEPARCRRDAHVPSASGVHLRKDRGGPMVNRGDRGQAAASSSWTTQWLEAGGKGRSPTLAGSTPEKRTCELPTFLQ